MQSTRWDEPAQTIVNCFRKTGITPEAQNTAITDVDDLFSDLKESLQQLHDIDPDMVPEGVTPESLNHVNKVISTAPMIRDDDFLRSYNKSARTVWWRW